MQAFGSTPRPSLQEEKVAAEVEAMQRQQKAESLFFETVRPLKDCIATAKRTVRETSPPWCGA